MSWSEVDPQSASALAKQLVDLVGVEDAVRAVVGVAPEEPWTGPRPWVSWGAFKKAVDALALLLRKHGAALDLLVPNAGLLVQEARQLLARRAKSPSLGASVVWHAQSLVQLWCFVEQIAAKGGEGREQIIRDAAKRGYRVQKMVSSPRPRSSVGKTISSAAALTKAYQKAGALLASEPEALAYFRATVDAWVDAWHECPDRPDRMGGYQRLLREKLGAAGYSVSESDTSAYAYQHWIKRLEEIRREQGAARPGRGKAKRPGRGKAK